MHNSGIMVFAAIPLLLVFTLVIWVMSYERLPNTALLNPQTDCVRHFLAHGIFEDGPDYPQQKLELNLEQLIPGDLLFCHVKGGQYGYYTHCALYLGNGKCTEQNLSDGMYIGNVADLCYGYHAISIKRAPINAEQRQQICDFARLYEGSVFDMAAHKDDPRLWNCAKLCWAAYKTVDIDLAPRSTHIIPDFLSTYPALDAIQELSLP